ncbi:MAG TPA: alpha-glucosidase [Polyangium sp.]|nr:alpha-glucosidase [Polyangium sp.]
MIGIQAGTDALRISLRGKLILEHSLARPCLMLAEGNPAIGSHRGNYHIAETIQSPIAAGPWVLHAATTDDVLVEFPNVARLRVYMQDDGAAFIELSGTLRKHNRLRMSLVANANDHVYGCGEQFSVLDLRGRKMPIWVQEKGVGRGNDLITKLANWHSKSGGSWKNTHFPQPTFISSGGLSCHIESPAYQEFDFRDADRHGIYVWGVPTRIRVDVGELPDLVTRLSAYLGRQAELPSWSYDGLWLGVQGGREVVAAKVRTARQAGIRVAAVWARDWEGGRQTEFGSHVFWNYHYDAILYPDLPAYIERLRETNVRFLGYINPMFVPEGDMYQYGKAKGYLVKDANGNVLHADFTTFPAGIVDFDNPDARRWFKTIIQDNMIKIGMSGWMAEFGESLSPDALLATGRKGVDAHNDYPMMFARVNREAIEEANGLGELAFFMRAGYSGSSRLTSAIWAGNQLVNWSYDDGFPTVIPAALSLGFCGTGFHHSDIGGYASVAWIKRPKELLLRWCEQAAFSPIMRTNEGNQPERNWQFDSDAETLAHFAHMVQMYYMMGPYHREVSKQYVQMGLPPMRHPLLHDPYDVELHALKYQYMYGPDLMVAPVLEAGKKEWRVYLPKDSWIHLWSGKGYEAGWHDIPAPIGKPPVFFREGTKFRNIFEAMRKVR